MMKAMFSASRGTVSDLSLVAVVRREEQAISDVMTHGRGNRDV